MNISKALFCTIGISLISTTMHGALQTQQPVASPENGLLSSDISELQKKQKTPTEIRVLLAQNVEGALIETVGSYRIFDPNTGKRLGSRLFGKSYRLHLHQDGLRWGEIFPGIYQILIEPGSPESSILVNGLQYHGKILCFATGNCIQIVNEIEIEDYLKSTLTAQCPHNLSSEALRAMAITARTEAFYRAATSLEAFWHVEAKTNNYQGYGVTLQNRALEEAIDATYQLVATYSNAGDADHPKLFPALWHEHCAGKTAYYRAIFRNQPLAEFDAAVESAVAAADRNNSKWQYRIKRDKLAHLLSLPKIVSIAPYVDKASGKTYALRFDGGKQKKDLTFFQLQNLLGKEVQSTDFTIQESKHDIMLQGFGKGHGVGLCLYSAQQMEMQGYNAAQMLDAFFPTCQIVSIHTE